MREFFKPWRRRIGCVTLAVACILAGLWVNSYFSQIHFDVPSGSVGSVEGRIVLFVTESDLEVRNPNSNGPQLRERKDVSACFIPYWTIVIPLTLLSAYLLLTKPRNSTSMKISESIPIEGT